MMRKLLFSALFALSLSGIAHAETLQLPEGGAGVCKLVNGKTQCISTNSASGTSGSMHLETRWNKSVTVGTHVTYAGTCYRVTNITSSSITLVSGC